MGRSLDLGKGVVAADTTLDPIESARLAQELPTLAWSLEEIRVAGALERVMLAGRLARYRVTACRRVRATLIPGDRCLLRFELEITDRLSGGSWRHLVSVRLWPTERAAHGFADGRLRPLLERTGERVDLEPLAAPIGVADELRASFSTFPLDEEAPRLVEATDPARIATLLSRALGDGRRGPSISRPRVTRAYPGPGPRWVITYEAEAMRGAAGLEPVVVFGTVAPGDWAKRAGAAATALRRRLRRRSPSGRFAVPEFLGFNPDAEIGLFAAVSGEPLLERLLAERIEGSISDPWGLTLEAGLESASRLLKLLHSCGVRSPRRRRGLDDLVAVRRGLRQTAIFTPGFAERLDPALQRAERLLATTDPLRPEPAHGDFRPSRLLFDGSRCSIVGLDSFCAAEPARDLGFFLAHLAVEAFVAAGEDLDGARRRMEDVRLRVVDAYIAASEERVDARALFGRVAAYELLGSLRVALECWQALESRRLAAAAAILEQP